MIKRKKKTLELIKRLVPHSKTIYDLGKRNDLSDIMQLKGYKVFNNVGGNDFDYCQTEIVAISTANEEGITTAFQILEHLANPFAVLQAIQSKELLVTVPLKVWFSRAYWNKKDPEDCHFHEFEARQIGMLLQKTGWVVMDSGKWYIGRGFGLRPFLRLFWPSYIWLHCRRPKDFISRYDGKTFEQYQQLINRLENEKALLETKQLKALKGEASG